MVPRLLALMSGCLVTFSLLGEIHYHETDCDFEDKLISLSFNNQVLARADSLPFDSFEDATDPYLEGYIQALIDMHYYEQSVIVSVKDHKVYLTNLPKNKLLSNSMVSFVGDLPGVKSVEVKEELSPEENLARSKYVETSRVEGVWFPQATVLFQPLVADPREPVYSGALRVADDVVGHKVIAVSLGDDFPIFRWKNVFTWNGDLQIGIQAGVWAIFNFSNVPRNRSGERCELMNTDFLGGIPLTYAFDRWSFRFRAYHISSHLGDEFLVNHPHFLAKRRNPSYEAVDFFTSYQFSSHVRAYFGPGVVCHSDSSFKLKPLYVQYGIEIRVLGTKIPYHGLYGTPFLAVHVENWQENHWGFDFFAKTGYEWSKLQGIGRKVRIYIDYHIGYSYEGQFFSKSVHYGELGLSWGF